MDKFAAILSDIPLQDFQKYILSLNLSVADYTFGVAMFALVVSLLAFIRGGGGRHAGGFSNTDALQARLDKVELSLADMRHKYANALSQLEMDLKTAQHDVAETRKIIEIVFTKKNATAETALDYQDYNRAASLDRLAIHSRGAPLDVRISKGEER